MESGGTAAPARMAPTRVSSYCELTSTTEIQSSGHPDEGLVQFGFGSGNTLWESPEDHTNPKRKRGFVLVQREWDKRLWSLS
jgi:hypothetical protein